MDVDICIVDSQTFKSIKPPADAFFVSTISRDNVERCCLECIEPVLEHLRGLGVQARGRLAILFDGYDKEREEIYEIAEIRAWVKALVSKYPYIFFFLTDFENNRHILAAAVASELKKIAHDPTRKAYISFALSKETSEKIAQALISYCVTLGMSPIEVRSLLYEIPWLQLK